MGTLRVTRLVSQIEAGGGISCDAVFVRYSIILLKVFLEIFV